MRNHQNLILIIKAATLPKAGPFSLPGGLQRQKGFGRAKEAPWVSFKPASRAAAQADRSKAPSDACLRLRHLKTCFTKSPGSVPIRAELGPVDPESQPRLPQTASRAVIENVS